MYRKDSHNRLWKAEIRPQQVMEGRDSTAAGYGRQRFDRNRLWKAEIDLSPGEGAPPVNLKISLKDLDEPPHCCSSPFPRPVLDPSPPANCAALDRKRKHTLSAHLNSDE